MDTHVSGYGAAAKTAPGGSAAREPKTPSTRCVVALLLSFALLGLVVVQHPLLFGDQVIDVSAKTGGADPEELKLPVSTKTAVKVSALSKLMHQLDRSSNCWLRDLGLSTSCHTTNDKADTPAVVLRASHTTNDKADTPAVVLRATGKDAKQDAANAARDALRSFRANNGKNVVADAQECLLRLLKKRNKASADAGEIVGGDVSGCDKSTCNVCMQADNPNNELKQYIGSSAAIAVYNATHPDILPYLNERWGGEQHYGKMVNGTWQNSNCPLGGPGQCLDKLLNRRVSNTTELKELISIIDKNGTAAQGVEIEGRSQADIIATCGSVELYVNILAAHHAEIDLQKLIKHTTLATEYEVQLEEQVFTKNLLRKRSEELRCIYVTPEDPTQAWPPLPICQATLLSPYQPPSGPPFLAPATYCFAAVANL
jgi:hypothetical protein